MSYKTLEELKATGDAPQFLQNEGYQLLINGYLLPDETPKGMYKRIAKGMSSYYPNKPELEQKFFDIMWKNYFCPSSPILSNGNTNRGYPISCNAIHIGDSITNIFMKNHELAMLSKNGAGVACWLGDIRGRGSPITGNGTSEGVVPWCKVLDTSISSVSQGCYDDKTELLTENGWVKFENLTSNTLVAQSSDTGEITFVDFTNYIKYNVDEELYSFTNDTKSIDLLVTKNHRMAIEYRKRISNKRDKFGKFINNKKILENNLRIIEASNLNLHRDNRFWTAARIVDGSKKILTSFDRFLIAYQADGSTNPSGNSTGSISGNRIFNFHFSKERKIKRLQSILNDIGFHYTINVQKDKTTNIAVRVPLDVKISKYLNDVFDLKTMCKSFAEEFVKEIGLWDGSVANDKESISYSSIIEENVNFLQAVSFIAGRQSKIGEPNKNKEYHNLKHRIYISDRIAIGGEEVDKKTVQYSGNVYCVTVPTGLLVVRRNGAVVICGNSSRRGAAALYLPIDHPDIEEFLNIRRPIGDANRRCLNINHAVSISNKWIEEMLGGDSKKRELWKNLLNTRVETGEPYIFFSDNVNDANPECYKQNNLTVKTSNLCSEVLLFTDVNHSFTCCLGSLNLGLYDEWKNTDTVNLAIRFLDAVLSEYIQKTEGVAGMEESRRSSIKGRALGLGVLGFHTLLQEKGLPFDSFETMQLNAEIFRTIRAKAEEETKILAEELGEPEWCKGFGRRNTHLLSIAPTVSNSTISGGHSAGIEPLPANIFVQKSAKGTFIRKNPTLEKLFESKNKNTLEIWTSINKQSGSVQHLDFLSEQEKEIFLTAREINQHTLIKLAAQRQRWIDQGQSLNLFFAANSSPKYIHEVHIAAWEQGLKTLYYFRSEGVIKGDMASRSADECKACEG